MVLGLTGGVGAGKSSVARFLQDKYNAALILSDDVAKEMMLPGKKAYENIVEFFGKDILDDKGFIDSKKLSKIVFSDENKLKKLNNITHPIVIEEIKNRIIQFNLENRQIIILESALLIDAGCDSLCDYIWFVKTKRENRIDRLHKDRGYSQEKSLSVIKSQNSDSDFEKIADDIILNDSNFEELENMIELKISKLIS